MELVRKRGSVPHFPFEEFRRQLQEYNNGPSRVWKSRECLDSAAAQEGDATAILGHIGAEEAEKWLAWGLGDLYAVGYRGGVLFCLPGGLVVV
jgi:hypothetical protein